MARPEFGSYVLAPWSNRIVGGGFPFEGTWYQVRNNFPDGTAIHGDVRSRPWKVQVATQNQLVAVLDSRRFPDFNFPFAYTFEHSLELTDQNLKVGLFLHNVGSRRAPAGLGFHPFVKRRLTRFDPDVMLVLPAEKVSPDIRSVPTGPPIPVSGPVDLRGEKFLGNPNLDHCYTALTAHTIRLIYPGTKVEAEFRLEPIYSHVVVYAPVDALGKAADYLSVEPVTHVNNGFNLYAQGWKGTGVKVLDPGERWGGYWELSFRCS